MKRTNKAFTIVEVIIVIAVIGILAAILILALPRAIDEANERSALSDAKNTLTELHIEKSDVDTLGNRLIILVEKHGKQYVFSTDLEKEGLTPCEANPFDVSEGTGIVYSLADMGVIDAPLGLTEIPLAEKFDNVHVYTGGVFTPLDSLERRIDVEVGREADMPQNGGLALTYKIDDTSIAAISDNHIKGVSEGHTQLIAAYGNLRYVYDVYVGVRVDIKNFAELKAACEDKERGSVFLYIDHNVGELSADREIMPIIIPAGKHVAFEYEWEHGETEYESDVMYNFRLRYDCAEHETGSPSILVNDGGIVHLNCVDVIIYNEDSPYKNDTDGFCPRPESGRWISNETGIMRLYGCNLMYEDYIGGTALNIYAPTIPPKKTYAEAMKNTYGSMLYNGGYAELEICYADYVENHGQMRITNETTCEALDNTGIIYELTNSTFSTCSGGLNMRQDSICNHGIIYEISECSFAVCKDMYGIYNDYGGEIRHVDKCEFYEVGITAEWLDDLLENGTITQKRKKQYEDLPNAIGIYIENGRIEKITDCTFVTTRPSHHEQLLPIIGIYGREGKNFKCVYSGTFIAKPENRFIADGAECGFDEESGMWSVSE